MSTDAKKLLERWESGDINALQFLDKAPDAIAALLEAEQAWRELVTDFVDPDECWYDHYGYCQAHMWFDDEKPCPHKRAQAALAAPVEVPDE